MVGLSLPPLNADRFVGRDRESFVVVAFKISCDSTMGNVFRLVRALPLFWPSKWDESTGFAIVYLPLVICYQLITVLWSYSVVRNGDLFWNERTCLLMLRLRSNYTLGREFMHWVVWPTDGTPACGTRRPKRRLLYVAPRPLKSARSH